jgi:nucleotide-binding universal stress UspA family protein
MKSILVPTDFSPTAKNAAMYALQLAQQLGIKRVVLYHSYEIPVTVDPLMPGIQMLDIESLKVNSGKSLENFELQIKAFANGVEIDHINEYGALADGLDDVCAKADAGLVVMGITGGSVLEEKLVGSNTVSVAKHTTVPVIIVPAEASFNRISSVMLASDFDKADTTVPVARIKKLLNQTQAKFYVFHVEKNEPVAIPSEVMAEDYAIHGALEELHPSYHFAQHKNFAEAVNDFVSDHQVDLIISVPKEHGFFAGLFSESHTKMLAFHSHVPVMVVHRVGNG